MNVVDDVEDDVVVVVADAAAVAACGILVVDVVAFVAVRCEVSVVVVAVVDNTDAEVSSAAAVAVV